MAGALVGRSAELDAIDEFLSRSQTRFQALVLEGEEGIGKTALWEAGVQRAGARGFYVLCGRPTAAEARLTWAGLADLLEGIPTAAFRELPDPQRHALEVALLQAEPQGSPAEERAIAAGFRTLAASLSANAPVLVAIDDMPWLDEPSLRAVEFALRRMDAEPVGLLATRRTEEAPGAPALQPLEVVEVGRLSVAAIHELLKARLGRSFPRPVLVRLFETSGGNPFFALEIAREIVRSHLGPSDPLPVPNDLRQLVRQRLGRLSPPAREVLLFAAAHGPATRPLLREAVDRDPAAELEEAEAAEIVHGDRGTMRFAHPLYAAAVYAAAPAERRRLVHGRLAEVVPEPVERARHLALASEAPSEEVAAALEQAGQLARTRGAAGAAAALFSEAGRLTPADRGQDRRRRILRTAEAQFDSGDTAAARALLEELTPNMPSGPERARALVLMSLIHYYEDGPGPAQDACRQALEDAHGDLHLEAEILLRLSLVAVDDIALARQSARRARELVAQDPDAPDDLLAASLLEDAYTQFLAGEGLAVEQVMRAEELKPPHARTWLAQRAQAALQVWKKYTDDLPRARELLEEDEAIRRAEGDDYSADGCHSHLAEVECLMGNFERAQERADAAARSNEQAGNPLWRAVVLYDQALIDAHRGRIDEARRDASEGLELAEAHEDPWIATLELSVLGFLELSVGDHEAADGWLTRAEENVAAMGLVEPARYRFHGDHIEAVLALGDHERAGALLARLERRAEVAPRPWVVAVSARCRGLLDASAGELGDAEVALDRALVEHERLAMPFERARTLLCLGQVQRRRNERRAARETLSEALEVFEALGAPLWADRARAELARIGVRRAPEELTAGEEAVAELAAQGLKNREIAAKLFMSQRTVEANLQRAYRKLGISSRAELGARMASSR
jgi:DNA-binding CsgD family transcriptional regulator